MITSESLVFWGKFNNFEHVWKHLWILWNFQEHLFNTAPPVAASVIIYIWKNLHQTQKLCAVIMSISTCRSRVRFWIYLWIINHLVMRLSQLIGVVKSNICRKQWFRGLGPRSRPILIYKPTEINQKPIMMSLQFLTLLKVYTEAIRNCNHNTEN